MPKAAAAVRSASRYAGSAPQYSSSNSESVSVELYEPGSTSSGVFKVRAAVAVHSPLAALASPESSARCSSSSDCRPTLFGAPGVLLPSRLVGTPSPGETSPPHAVTRLGDQPRWSGVIGSCPSAPTKSLACPVTYQ